MCGLEFPDLESEIWQRFKEDIVMVGADPGGLMGGDNTSIIKQFKDQTGVTFPIGVDLSRSYGQYRIGAGISPFPLDIVIGKDGKIAYVSRQFNQNAMVSAIEALLAQ